MYKDETSSNQTPQFTSVVNIILIQCFMGLSTSRAGSDSVWWVDCGRGRSISLCA